MPHDEEALLDALARLHAAGADQLIADTRLVGSFRAHGLLVPVWDLPGRDRVRRRSKSRRRTSASGSATPSPSQQR